MVGEGSPFGARAGRACVASQRRSKAPFRGRPTPRHHLHRAAWGALLGRRLSQRGVLVFCLDYRNFPQVGYGRGAPLGAEGAAAYVHVGDHVSSVCSMPFQMSHCCGRKWYQT